MATPVKRLNHRTRRGSIYVLTLGTTMIVAVLGLAALTLVRVQRMQMQGGDDMRNAQAYAKVALDMAWYRVQNDSSWRSKMASGDWSTDQVIGDGYYSFTATDPFDGNLTNSAVHPVVIVGVGKCGNSTQKLQMEIRALQPGIRCLEPVVLSNNNLVFDNTTVTSDRMVSANHDAEVKNNAQAYTNKEAANNIKSGSGGVWYGSTTTNGTWPRQLPNVSTLYSYYNMNGTPINYNDLPTWNANLIDNPGAQASLYSVSPWYPVGDCSVSLDLNFGNPGWLSFKVSDRDSTGDFLAQDVTSKLQSGVTYYTEAQVRTASNDEVYYTVKLKVVSSGSGTQYFNLTNTDKTKTSWLTISGNQTVTWTGTLTQAEFYVYADQASRSYYVDEVIMQEAGAPSDVKVIHRQLLSPTSNPFGSGVKNGQGIYIIDCGGKKISIRNSRIVGTLILLNQNEGGSEIAGSINWTPAVTSADPMATNLPVLLSNKQLNLYFANTPLDEGLRNANFNPTGATATPYNDSQDTDMSDSYPSLINGVVYTEKKVSVTNSPTITGVLVAGDDINVKDATLGLKYDPIYYERNAPPGFQATVTYYIVPNSYRQVVN